MLTRRLVGGICSKLRVISAYYVKLASPTGQPFCTYGDCSRPEPHKCAKTANHGALTQTSNASNPQKANHSVSGDLRHAM
jgi:hypothetical protein